MRRTIRISLQVFVSLILVLAVAGLWLVWRQGHQPDEYDFRGFTSNNTAPTVTFDSIGTPTVSASNWQDLVTAQGYVVASERLFQMDLTRRKASGRLSELFGRAALEVDKEAQAEDRLHTAEVAAANLPANEKQYCDAYSTGVNQFIERNSWRWGIEYLLLRTKPQQWTCADSLLVVLAMSETLTGYGTSELEQWHLRSRLDREWDQFLYPNDHPWNQPMFGSKPSQSRPLPPTQKYLPLKPLNPAEHALETIPSEFVVGSNSWAWSGKTGTYLANDPHLGQSVPGIWYPMRLRVGSLNKAEAPVEWVVGVALPGLPGIVIGMNKHLAWGFTNTGEDIDDMLEEKLSSDGNSYIASYESSTPKWQPLEKKIVQIKVRGEADQALEIRKTSRGPIVLQDEFPDKVFSRQWLALRSEFLRVPVIALNQAKNWEEMNQAIDGMRLPAQNILVTDRQGRVGYRVSGTGVERKITGRTVQSATDGAWLGYYPSSERRRDLLERSETDPPIFKATANQRIWVDEFGHSWASDDRADRILSVLRSRDDFSARAMVDLQMDTVGRFRKLLLDWVAANSSTTNLGMEAQNKLKAWSAWNGSSVIDPESFTDSIDVETELLKILLSRVREHLTPGLGAEHKYSWYMKRAWLISTLETKDGLLAFGLTESEVATYLLNYVANTKDRKSFEERNRWVAQHPFKDRIPLIGKLFAVREFSQYGYSDLVRAESPRFGPSVRLALSVTNPKDSLWNIPVGQSGHIRSKHFKDRQGSWFTGEALPVFSSDENWGF